MKRTGLILLLLLTIFNDAEFKQNILTQMEEEPILTANLGALRNEASRAVQRLFGINFSFSTTVFDKEVVIHYGNPKITAKLSSSCSASFSLGRNGGSIKVKNGVTISQTGTKINLSKSTMNSIGKNLNIDFNKSTLTLTNKLKGAVVDGTVNFSFSLLGEAKIQLIFSSKGNNSCDGSLTITIKPGSNPKPSTQPAYNPQAIQQAASAVATGGAIAIGAVLLFKLVKGVAGFCVGGPVGALIGVAT